MKEKKILNVILFLLVAFLPGIYLFGQMDQTVVTSDGKKVVLHPNKTWEFIVDKPSTPESATTKTGRIVSDELVDLIALLKPYDSQLQKSEFETNSEYTARLQTLLAGITNSKTGHTLDQAVFVSPNATYDAERKRYWFSTDFLSASAVEIISGKKYVHNYSLQIVEWGSGYWSPIGFDIRRRTIEFSMDSAAAMVVKPDLRFAIVGSPVQIRSGQISLVPLKYIAFNLSTGERYLEISEKEISMPIVVPKPIPTPKPMATPVPRATPKPF